MSTTATAAPRASPASRRAPAGARTARPRPRRPRRTATSTHVTHVRWVESGRCSAWGRIPADTRATTSRAAVRADRSARRRCQSANPSKADGADDHREEPQEQRVRGGEVGEPPPRRLGLGDRLQRAVEVRPRRRARQLAPGPQVDDRVHEHPRPRRPGPAIARCTHIGTSPTTIADGQAPGPTGLAARQHQPAEHQADGEDEVGPVGEGQSGEHRRRLRRATRAARRDPTSALARTANTPHHSVSASPPFHAIAVSPIGVST